MTTSPPEKILSLSAIVAAYWPVILCSFLVSFLATPICRAIARRHHIVDRPDDLLKPHKRPVPYLGGVAIFLGWATGIMLALAMFGSAESPSANMFLSPSFGRALHFSEAPNPSEGPVGDSLIADRNGPGFKIRNMIGALVAGLAATLLGLLDDLRALSPLRKLAGLTVATVLMFVTGIGDESFRLVFKAVGSIPAMPFWLILACSLPIVWFVVAGACNATNLIDGMDGLCSGVLGIIAAGFLILSVHMHTYSQWHPMDAQRVVVSLAMMGAALGFLPYNRNPATIFMGDAGSMLLGITVAIMLLLFAESSGVRWLLGSVMVFGLPLGDMLLTLTRRWRSGHPLMQGDRSHYYDQLADRGWAPRRVVRLSYGIALIFALAGCAAIFLRVRYLVPLYGAIALASACLVHRAGMTGPSGVQKKKKKPADVSGVSAA